MKESDLWYIFFCLCPCFRDATHYSSWWPLSMRNKVKGKNVFWLPPKQEVGEILQRKHMFLLLLSNMGISLTPQWIFPVGHRKQKINLIGLFVHSPFPTLYLKIIWLYMHLKNNLQAFIIGKYVVHNYLRRSKTIPCLVFFFFAWCHQLYCMPASLQGTLIPKTLPCSAGGLPILPHFQ